MDGETGALRPAAAPANLDGRDPTAQSLSAPMIARTRVAVWMVDVNALRVSVGMTVVLSSAYWTVVTMAIVLKGPVFVKKASLVRTVLRPTALTTAWVEDAVLMMSVFVMSHGQALTALSSSVLWTAMTVDAALMVLAIVMRASLERTVGSSVVLTIATIMACA